MFCTIGSDVVYEKLLGEEMIGSMHWKLGFLEKSTLPVVADPVLHNCLVYKKQSLFWFPLKCHCDEIWHFFFPLFFYPEQLIVMYDVLSYRKKKLKRFPSLKFRRSKSEISCPPLLEIGSSWARYFRSGNSTCDIFYLTRDWWSLDFRGISVGFWLKYLRNVCWFRSSIWGKFVWKQYWRLLWVFRG